MRNPKSAIKVRTPNDSFQPTTIMPGRKDNNMLHQEDSAVDSRGCCPVCGSGDVWTFVEIREVPVHSNVLLISHSEALSVPRGDLEMKCCRDCGHVYNGAFSSEDTKYCSDYENSLFFSETYRTYASSLAAELIERFDLHGRSVIEIGCGSGDFLKLLCEKGENDGIGFDPSALAGRSINSHRRINYVRDYYSGRYAHIAADFLCCRHVLEHVEFPLNFIKEIREALPAGKKVGLFFEVPDVMFMLKEHSSWDFIYEHCSYFSTSSLNRLFAMSGFKVSGMWRTFHDQFICACIEPANTGTTENEIASDRDKKDVLYHAELFCRIFQEQVQVWGERLQSMTKSQVRVVLWGAGSKGVTFLNILHRKGFIEYVVDINEQKIGKYVPGTGQRIVSPDFLKIYRPDVVILMNQAYETEVQKKVGEMNLSPKILLVNQL